MKIIKNSESGESFVISLLMGGYNWQWFNPANGIHEDLVTLKNSTDKVTFNKT